MHNEIGATYPQDARADSFEAMEIGLALDLQHPEGESFETCLRNAAEVVGGEVLFEMPSDGSLDDASRIAAIRVPTVGGEAIVFAILNAAGDGLRVADRDDVGERFHGFARAFVGVLERIRDDLGHLRMRPGGNA